MRIHSGLGPAIGRLAQGAVAIGNFDGVHLGHQALFAAARKAAAQHQGPVCGLTFEPHPARLLAPAYAPPLISSPSRKRELLAAQGVTDLVEQPFDAAFARRDPEAFVEALCATSVVDVVVGHDFTYGRARGGNVDSLRRALEERGVRLHLVPPVAVNGLVVSSTKVREFVLEGRLEAAAALLGRPFDLDGEVVRGAGRGRTLGWPTANLRTSADLLPAVGVYAVRARLLLSDDSGLPAFTPPGGPTPSREPEVAPPLSRGPAIAGAANLGLNPTFRAQGGGAAGGEGKPPLLLEVHLLDFEGDLYGRRLRIEFVRRLREERRFPGPDALKAQIAQDVAEARRILLEVESRKLEGRFSGVP